VAAQALAEVEAGTVQDFGVELATVGDDDADGRAGLEVRAGVGEHGGDPLDVVRERPFRRPSAELQRAEVGQPEQLVRVPVLLVVVDQAGIRRRGDDAVEAASVVELAGVAVQHGRGPIAVAHARELLDPSNGVEPVALEEVRSALDRAALPLVLVAPVRITLGDAREVEVEVRRQPRRPSGAREHHAQHVRVLVAVDEPAEREQVAGGLRRVPAADECGRRDGLGLGDAAERVAHLAFEREQVVRRRLDATEEDIEGGDVRAGRIPPTLERLDERGARAAEGVEDVPGARHVPVEQHLDELRDELAEVRVQRVDVLRPLALRQVGLRPRQCEVDVGVERVLGRSHGPTVFDGRTATPGPGYA
jgi:hypothetical protein